MGRLHLSNHALLRFLEHRGGLDFEALREGLEEALGRAHSAARDISESDYLVKVDGLTFVVRGTVVVNVMDHPSGGRRAAELRR